MTDRELLKMALEAIDWLRYHLTAHHGCLHMDSTASGIPAWLDWLDKSEAALRAALAEPAEPVAWMIVGVVEDVKRTVFVGHNAVGDYRHLWGNAESVPLYTAPAPRKPLTDEEIKAICEVSGWDSSYQSMRFARTVIAAYEAKQGGGT